MVVPVATSPASAISLTSPKSHNLATPLSSIKTFAYTYRTIKTNWGVCRPYRVAWGCRVRMSDVECRVSNVGCPWIAYLNKPNQSCQRKKIQGKTRRGQTRKGFSLQVSDLRVRLWGFDRVDRRVRQRHYATIEAFASGLEGGFGGSCQHCYFCTTFETAAFRGHRGRGLEVIKVRSGSYISKGHQRNIRGQ